MFFVLFVDMYSSCCWHYMRLKHANHAGVKKIVIAAALAGALFHPQTHPPNEDGFAAAVYV